MRRIPLKYRSIHPFLSCRALVLALSFILLGMGLSAQEETAGEEKEQIRSRMSLSVVQGDENSITLKALVRARIDERYTGLPELEVVFFAITDTLEQELGKAQTDDDGIATLAVTNPENYRDTADAFYFVARFDGNDEFSGSEGDISVVDAEMMLEPIEEDSLKTMKVTLQSRGEPVADVDVSLFVKGMINPLPIGDATTDESGEAQIEFPLDLPGDTQGNVQLFARVEDHELFGNLEAHMTKAWGIPVEAAPAKLPRALWSPDPPLWLLLSFVGLLLIIWGHYIEVIYKLFRLKKSAAKESAD